METPEQNLAPRGDGCGDGAPPDGSRAASTRHGLSRIDRALIGLTLAVAAIVTIPRLPPGVCHADSGGLQLASATLGITHPPGYAGYSSLGYLVTLVPGVDHAYMISVACLGSGIVVLWLCIMMQIRLGVAAGVACALALGLTVYPRVWSNLLVPEVYMPSLMFEAAAAYAIMRYARHGSRRMLYLAAFLFGILVSNRPPAALALPLYLAASWIAAGRWEGSWRRRARTMVLASAVGALPGLYTLGYLWVRDTPDAAYNYIEHFNAEAHVVPQSQDGPQAKVHRILWLITGRQFGSLMGNSWPGVLSKLMWLRYELLPVRWSAFFVMPTRLIISVSVILSLVLATVMAYARCRVATLLLVGMAAGSIVFVCMYRVNGDAANILPLLFALTVLFGVACSVLFPARGNPWQRRTALALATAACIANLMLSPQRRGSGLNADAGPFLARVDMPTLPRNAVICSHWGSSTPLWYAQRFLFNRLDITVITAPANKWARLTEGLRDRPIFATDLPAPEHGFKAEPYRNLWRLEHNPPSDTAEDSGRSP